MSLPPRFGEERNAGSWRAAKGLQRFREPLPACSAAVLRSSVPVDAVGTEPKGSECCAPAVSGLSSGVSSRGHQHQCGGDSLELASSLRVLTVCTEVLCLQLSISLEFWVPNKKRYGIKVFTFPLKKPTRHGSILSRESPADKKQKVERCSSTHDFDPTDSSSKKTKSSSEESRSETYGLVQRCVVIQRDENGFGLTVSGDNPVFVQSVKEDGAAMRAGVQTGDRIIKVNGTLVTHSNHLEVVKLIKSGSYVALTVQGRPPGSPQIPLADSEVDLAAFGHMSPIMTSPHSPGTSGNAERITSPVLVGEENNIVHNQKVEILKKMLQKEQERLQVLELREFERGGGKYGANKKSLQEEYSRSPTTRLLKEIQETKKHIPQLQEQLSKATGYTQDGVLSSRSVMESLQISEVEAESGDCVSKLDYSGDSPSRPNSDIADSPRSGLKERIYLDESPEKTEVQDTDSQSSVGSPLSRGGPQIIGAEDDDFDTEQEQINGQCSCFQNIELLKSRPAHLAVLLHHVVSQFDPAAL
ncbi:PREDICTED: rho guanine nucleotide exchange factor 12-like, partial [Fulmarus glacialis]|uniref:rho guanine nucleotide exchange factor 12-like n=1 Tax=Fulmarus glacialis TaxID=30455 RepID=UPI00051C9E74